MAQRVHVQDDLFFLAISLKTIQDGFNLDLDSEYFQQKLAADLGFIHSAHEGIYDFLQENPRLINRQEYLAALLDNISTYSAFLSGVMNKDFPLSACFESSFPQFKVYWDRDREIISEIQAALSLSAASDQGQSDLVSRDELSGLLGPDDEDAPDTEK
jgi:hypothetical protein